MMSMFRPTSTRPDPATLVRRGLSGDMIVVDIREPREIAATGAATVALRIPLATLRMRADPRSPECHPDLKNGKPVLLYCASGGRAAMAADMLREFGHAEVHNLGGLADWQAAGGPVAR